MISILMLRIQIHHTKVRERRSNIMPFVLLICILLISSHATIASTFYSISHESFNRANVIGVLNSTYMTYCHVTCQNLLTCTNIVITTIPARDERVTCYLLSGEKTTIAENHDKIKTKGFFMKKVRQTVFLVYGLFQNRNYLNQNYVFGESDTQTPLIVQLISSIV